MNSNSGMKVDMVSMSDALSDPTAQIMGGADGVASVDAIPDLDALTSNIIEILEYLEEPDVRKILQHNESIIRMSLYNRYADTVPLKFIDLFMEKDPVMKSESIERTMRWIEVLAKVNAGTADLETESQKLVDEVNHRYVYSKYGSKEAFEAALQQELSKEKKGGQTKVRGF